MVSGVAQSLCRNPTMTIRRLSGVIRHGDDGTVSVGHHAVVTSPVVLHEKLIREDTQMQKDYIPLYLALIYETCAKIQFIIELKAVLVCFGFF